MLRPQSQQTLSGMIRRLLPLLVLLAPGPAWAQPHPLMFFEGRFAGSGDVGQGLLWRGDRHQPPVALEITSGGEGVTLRWSVSSNAYAADITGTVSRHAYREADDEGLTWQCRAINVHALNDRANTVGARLACRPIAESSPLAAVVVDLWVAVDHRTYRSADTLQIVLTEYSPGRKEPARRIEGRLARRSG